MSSAAVARRAQANDRGAGGAGVATALRPEDFPDAAPAACPARRPWWLDARVVGAGFALAAYLALGVVLGRVLDYHEPDAFSRTASAYQALFGREQRMAVLGAVWTPLPALVQMPFLVLLSPFGLQELAGAVVGALATVAMLAFLDHLARSLGLPSWLRIGLLVLFALHPMVLLFAANGQAEPLFLLLLVATTCQLMRWADDARPERVLTMGYVTGAAFLARYETIPFGLAVGAALMARQLVRTRGKLGPLVPTALYFSVPVLLAVFWWLRFNWEVTGDPLYFFWGPYSNVAQTAAIRTPGHDLFPYYQDLPAAARFVLDRVWLLSPGAVHLAPIVLLGAIMRRSWSAALTTWALASIPLFSIYQIYAGLSSAQFRYSMVAVPAGFVLACLAWQHAPARARPLVGVLALALSAAAIPTSFAGMADHRVGRMEWGIVSHLAGRPYGPRDFTQFKSERAVAHVLDARAERTPVLVDTVTGFPAIAFSRYPGQLVSTTDVDFEGILAAPYGKVEHILVHDPSVTTDPNPMGKYGRVLQVHPDLLDGDLYWARPEGDYGGWKLFRVVSPPPTQVPLDAPTGAR